MTERPAGRRNRSRSSEAAALAHLPRLHNPWSPVEIFTAEQVARMMNAAYRVLEEIGMEIRSPSARAVYRDHGALVDEETQIVRIGRDIVQAFCAHAPETFVLHARNPERDLHVGGNVVNFGPVNGAPHISDSIGGRRYGDINAFRDILKVTHQLGILHWQGGVVVEPVDLPVSTRHLDMYHSHIELSDTVWAARGVGGIAAQDALDMSAIEHGTTLEGLAQKPRLMMVTNVNSPRRVDEEILDGIMLLAQHGQCVCVTPFTLMGAMAPISLPGALVQQQAEALGIITLVQMIRPGCPAVIGGFTSNVDMRTGSPAFGTPEYVRATLAGGQIARALKLPYRTSAPNASPCVDAQAAYETSLSLFAAIMSHGNLVNHAAGWLESGLSASLEKIVIDSEILRSWAWSMQKIEVTKDDLALEAIKAVPPGGHFFGSPHTMSRFEHAFYRPLVSDWRNFETWRDAGSQTATQRATGLWKRILAEYQPPPMEVDVEAALLEFMAKRGLDTRVFR